MADLPRPPQGFSDESAAFRACDVAMSDAARDSLAISMRARAFDGTLLDFFAPLRDSDLKLDRPHGPSRRWLDFSDPEWD